MFLVFIFCPSNKLFPSVPAEFDDLFVEWKHTDVMTKSTFEGAIAAIEFSLPTFKLKPSFIAVPDSLLQNHADSV